MASLQPSLGRIVRGRVLPWALAVLALAAAATFLLLWRAERSEAHRRTEVAVTARSFLVALTTFGADTIDRDVEEIRAFATGTFAEEVDQTFSDQRVGDIRDANVESVGRVRDVFVQSLSGVEASAFGVVEETVRNDSTPEGRTDTLRVSLDLVETADGWKVSRVEVLQSPANAPLG